MNNFEAILAAAAVLGTQVEQMRWSLLDAEVRAEDPQEILNLRASLTNLQQRHAQVEAAILR